EDYMNEDIVSVNVEDRIKKAAKMMKDNDFSQLPVKRNNNYVGLITSTDIASEEDRDKPIETMKLHSLPVIPYDTPKEDFTDMFNTHRAVLIEKNGKKLGLITPADLL
ncbi:MAG: CBS domain-containing protein, partial [Thermoplasmata archaeon]